MFQNLRFFAFKLLNMLSDDERKFTGLKFVIGIHH